MSEPQERLRLSVDRDRCVGAGMCALTAPEVQMMYRSMKTKMAARGVTLQ